MKGELEMKMFENLNLDISKFFYVDSLNWLYAERVPESENNIVFVTEGVLHMEINGNRYSARQNEFLFMPHGSISRGYRASDMPTSFYHIIFSSDMSLEIPEYFALKDTNRIRAMYSLITDLSTISNYDQSAKNKLLSVLLFEITYQLSAKPSLDTDKRSTVELMKKYIRNSIHRNITLRDVANHFGFSTAHANRLFSNAEHITVKTYITKLKIQLIEEYLMSTNISTDSIAKKLGFTDAHTLNKYYRYHTGKTIKEFHSRFID